MSGADITIDLPTLVAEDALTRLLAAATDLRPMMLNIGEYEAQSTKDRIARGVTPEGQPFKTLNPLYEAFEKKGPGILRGASGDLASIVYQLAGDASVEVGNNVVYGAIHQFGGTIKPKSAPALVFSLGGATVFAQEVTIPARPYLGVSKEDEQEILAIMADHFIDAGGGEIFQE